MPPRQLGLAAIRSSTSSLLQGYISLDFLLPFAATSRAPRLRTRARYHSTAIKAVEEEAEESEAGPSTGSSSRHALHPTSEALSPKEVTNSTDGNVTPRSRVSGRIDSECLKNVHIPEASHSKIPRNFSTPFFTPKPSTRRPPTRSPHFDDGASSGQSRRQRTTTPHSSHPFPDDARGRDRHKSSHLPRPDQRSLRIIPPRRNHDSTIHADPSSVQPPRLPPVSHRSIVHEFLAKSPTTPPLPIFHHLRRNPSRINVASLTALADHAARTGHHKDARLVRAARARIDDRFSADALARETGPAEDAATTHIRVGRRAHRWARRIWRPEEITRPRTTSELMSDLHFRLLHADPGTLDITPLEAVQSVRELCAMERRRHAGTIEALSGVMHLFVLYANRLSGGLSMLQVLRRFLILCPEVRANRQTLQVMAKEILWPSPLDYPSPIDDCAASQTMPCIQPNYPADKAGTLHSDDSEHPEVRPSMPTPHSDHDAPVQPVITHIFRVPASTDPNAWSDLLDLIRTFHVQLRITPGTETFRHMVKFALARNQPDWARPAFEGWWCVAKDPAGRTPGEGDLAKFRHDGRKWILWRGLLRVMLHRGWMKRVEGASERTVAGYEWVERINPETRPAEEEGDRVDQEVETVEKAVEEASSA